jgi:hypothetical protein
MILGVAAVAMFAALVHAVLLAAHVAEPAATTVYGLTVRRLWATAAALLGLAGVVIGGLALARPLSRFSTASAWWRDDFTVRLAVINGLPGVVVDAPEGTVQTTAFAIEGDVTGRCTSCAIWTSCAICRGRGPRPVQNERAAWFE